jgi:hypothetical protein
MNRIKLFKRTIWLLAWSVLLACFISPKSLSAEESAKEGQEEKIAYSKLPKSVKETLVKTVPGAEVLEVEKEENGGVVVYEIEVKVKGKTYEVVIEESGKLVSKKEEKEDEDDDDDNDDS